MEFAGAENANPPVLKFDLQNAIPGHLMHWRVNNGTASEMYSISTPGIA